MQKWREDYVPPPHLLSFSVLKLFNKLSAENICLPTNKCNLVPDLSMSPSGWKEGLLPHNRSEISQMLSGKLKY